MERSFTYFTNRTLESSPQDPVGSIRGKLLF
jgi:hypothetical protein